MVLTSSTEGIIHTLKDIKFNSIEEVLKELYYGAYLCIDEPIEQQGYNIPPKESILFYDIDNNCYVIFENFSFRTVFLYCNLNKLELTNKLKNIHLENIKQITLTDKGLKEVKEILSRNEIINKINEKVGDTMKCKGCDNIMTLERDVILNSKTPNDKEIAWNNTYKCTNKDCGCITKVWKYINTDTQEVIREEQITYQRNGDTLA